MGNEAMGQWGHAGMRPDVHFAMPSERIWRVRKRSDHIDAEIGPHGAEWELRIVRNGRRLLAWRFADREAATAEAVSRRRELERSGWQSHW
jgi:hypothetical protein